MIAIYHQRFYLMCLILGLLLINLSYKVTAQDAAEPAASSGEVPVIEGTVTEPTPETPPETPAEPVPVETDEQTPAIVPAVVVPDSSATSTLAAPTLSIDLSTTSPKSVQELFDVEKEDNKPLIELSPEALTRRDDPGYYMVAVEALVVEIIEERTRELGLSFLVNDNANNFQGSLELGGRPAPILVNALIKDASNNNSVVQQSRVPGLGITLAGMSVGTAEFSMKLQALLTQGDASIRTRPIAVALNGSEVTIESVDEVPVRSVAGGANGATVIDNKTAGVIMKVVPTIESLRPGKVSINVLNLEVSSVYSLNTTEGIDRPTFSKSSTRIPKVTIHDGETFVVGGLKTRRMVHSEEKTWLLGSIPLVGYLFRSQRDHERNTDVLFFMTPKILQPGENFLVPYDFKNQRALGLKDFDDR